jgi:hypothetical protein
MAPYSELFGIRPCAEHIDSAAWVEGCAECDRERREVVEVAGPFDHHESERFVADYFKKRASWRPRRADIVT